MVKNTNTLAISEDFYSVQCEGVTTGVPAYFIRLKGCNLMCGGPDGSLMKIKKATWWCDTEYVWKAGEEKPFQYLASRWTDQDLTDWIKDWRVHLIWTGGEPTIPRHQKNIVSFLDWFIEGNDCDYPFSEIETNGTQYIEDDLFKRLSQINCSVKLANSGMNESRRIKPEALERIMDHENYWFKFVISDEDDILEIERDFVKPFNIPPRKVLMMPGLDNRKDFHERTRFCMEIAKDYGYTGLTRLHISAWNQTVGV